MPKGGCENAHLMSSCCPVFTSGCARGWTCYTGMTRAKILHVLQKQGIIKDEFSTSLHLVAFHRSNSSLCGHSSLRVDIAREELRLHTIFLLVLPDSLELWSARYNRSKALGKFWIKSYEPCGFQERISWEKSLLCWPGIDGVWGCFMPKAKSSTFSFTQLKTSRVCLKWCCWSSGG